MNETMSDITKLRTCLASGQAIIMCDTEEDERFKAMLCNEKWRKTMADGSSEEGHYTVMRIAADGKLEVVTWQVNPENNVEQLISSLYEGADLSKEGNAYHNAFRLAATKPRVILILLDWQYVAANPLHYRPLKEAKAGLEAMGSHVVGLAPRWKGRIPPELNADIKALDLPVAGDKQLQSALNDIMDATEQIPEVEQQVMIRSVKGLPIQKAKDALAWGYVVEGKHDPMTVSDVKLDMIRGAGLLKISKSESVENIGGLEPLKEFITNEVVAAQGTKLAVRRVLLYGPPGSGKSLSSKALSSLTQTPLLECSFSQLKGSKVGESESNMYKVLKDTNALGFAVLWIDELDNALGDTESSARTGSTTGAMVGIFSTWMEEEQGNGIIVVCTANSVENIPDKILSRFDDIWFVDLPTHEERVAIAKVHLRINYEGENGEALANTLADLSDNWSGREIRRAVISAVRRAAGGPITTEAMEIVAGTVHPLADANAEKFARMREHGRANYRMANTPEAPKPKPVRKIAAPTLKRAIYVDDEE